MPSLRQNERDDFLQDKKNFNKDGFAVAFTTPGTICEPMKSSGGEISIKACGVGKATLRILRAGWQCRD